MPGTIEPQPEGADLRPTDATGTPKYMYSEDSICERRVVGCNERGSDPGNLLKELPYGRKKHRSIWNLCARRLRTLRKVTGHCRPLARTGISQLLGSKIIRRFTQYRMIGWTGGS